MKFDLVIRNGLIITSEEAFVGDIGISGEQIGAVASGGLEGDEVIDAEGLYVIPGAIDGHVHLYDPNDLEWAMPSADTFETGTRSAARGGVTTVIDFAMPGPGTSLVESYERRLADARNTSHVDYGLHLGIRDPDPQRLDELPAVVERGCGSLKLYMAYEGYQLPDDAILRAMQAIGRLGGLAIVHAEHYPTIVELRRQASLQNGMPSRELSPEEYARTCPSTMEGAAIHVAIGMAATADVPLLIFHVTCSEGVEEIGRARRRGQAVFGEARVHNLVLTEDFYKRSDYPLQTSPPLRDQGHLEDLWSGLRRGDLDIISSDHAPVGVEIEEDQSHAGTRRVQSGTLGTASLEPRLALMHSYGVNRGRVSLSRWVDICCTRPAEVFGLRRKGRLVPGFEADIVLFDPEKEVTLSAQTLQGPHDVTVYDGIRVKGVPVATLSRGELIAKDGDVIATPGRGKFVPLQRDSLAMASK